MPTNHSNVQALAARFAAFNPQLIDFVAQCGKDDWRKVTKAEGWSVGVTAHHIGATHYPLIEWVQMFVEGRPLPPVTMAMVDEMKSAKDLRPALLYRPRFVYRQLGCKRFLFS